MKRKKLSRKGKTRILPRQSKLSFLQLLSIKKISERKNSNHKFPLTYNTTLLLRIHNKHNRKRQKTTILGQYLITETQKTPMSLTKTRYKKRLKTNFRGLSTSHHSNQITRVTLQTMHREPSKKVFNSQKKKAVKRRNRENRAINKPNFLKIKEEETLFPRPLIRSQRETIQALNLANTIILAPMVLRPTSYQLLVTPSTTSPRQKMTKSSFPQKCRRSSTERSTDWIQLPLKA